MSYSDAAAPAITAAAATPLHAVHLDIYNEVNVQSWISSHEMTWHINRITKFVDKFQLMCKALPASITNVYGPEVGRCGLGADPYAAICAFLVVTYGRNKWFSYFELLSMPIAVEGIRPTALLGKLKSYLPHGADDSNELFMAMFLMRLPPSTREAVGTAGNATVGAMCTHAESIYNFRGGYEAMVAAAAAQRSRSPAKTDGKRSEKQGKARSKNRSTYVSFGNFKNPNNGSCKFHNYYKAKSDRCVAPCNVAEN
jgi:hypothetical protein